MPAIHTNGQPTSRMASGCIPDMRRRNIKPLLHWQSPCQCSGGQCVWAKRSWGAAMAVAGRHERWITLRPEALLSWLMAPLAITLGFRPSRTGDRSVTPTCETVQERILADKTLSSRHVYVCRTGPSLSSTSSDQVGLAVCARTPLLRFRLVGLVC